MTRLSILLLALGIATSTFQVASAEESSRTCALTKGFECSSMSGCQEWSIQEMELPRFIRIDLKAGTIQSLDKNITRVTPFKNMDHVEDMLVLHGTEKRGWSIAIGEKTGNLTLSASGDGESFVVFGSCMNQ
ncbi:MAG: hypothetical protein PHO83_12325 [Geobacteraceae bacterium]|nr:hypothetical protein [Geobacteraceae bacterium]